MQQVTTLTNGQKFLQVMPLTVLKMKVFSILKRVKFRQAILAVGGKILLLKHL